MKSVRKVDELKHQDILDLLNGQFLAVVVSGFYDQALAQALNASIIASQDIEQYTHEIVANEGIKQLYFGVDRIGLPLNSTYQAAPESPAVNAYFTAVPMAMQRLRSFSSPAFTPIDKLRLNLDEAYADGATVAKFFGRKAMAGVARIGHAELSHLSAEQPHFDALPARYAEFDKQLAANIYLNVPASGGQLELWDVPDMNPLAIPPDDWRRELPASILVTPQLGDLIIFNCRKPHAITAFVGAPRVTVQTFIGYQQHRPLQIWN